MPGCRVKEDVELFYIACENEQEGLEFTFVIEGYSYTLAKEKFFRNYENIWTSNIVFSKKLEEEWSVGLMFFKEYRLLFDYTKGRVGIQGEGRRKFANGFVEVMIEVWESKVVENKEYFLVAFVAMVLCLLIYFVVISRKKKQNEEIELKENEA